MQQYHFELLKKNVSEVSDIPNITAADCKNLSDLIFKKTKACISETTLKRVYGLVQSKHNPSQFTLDALCKYCGYESIGDFLIKHGQQPAITGLTSWSKIAADVNNITNFTIRALKNRSGIPFKYTIARKSASFYLDAFLASDAVATALIAPAGFGKSIALLHWLEEKLELNAANKSNDIFLFFSTQVLMSVLQSGQSIHFWLLSLLGCGNTEYHEILKNAGKGKFYLIIDGFDGTTFRNDQFQLILNQLINILGIYHESRCFRLILTMRSNTWINCGREFGFIRKKWFESFIGDPGNAINMPLLGAPEIMEISQLINPKAGHGVSIDVAETLCNPLYLELYYKLNPQTFNLQKIDALTRYELTSNLVLEKIYFNRYAVEKTQFLYELISLMNLKDESSSMGQVQVSELAGSNEQVYQALDSLHFLRTINKSTLLQQNIYMEFCSKDTLEYFIAQWLLSMHGNRFNEALIGYINDHLNHNLRLSVVKWLVLTVVNAGEKNELHNLTHISIPLNLKAGLLSFLSDVLEHEYVTLTADGTGMQKFRIEDSLLDYFIGIEFMAPGYLKTLNTLLRFEISSDRRFLLHCYKAILGIVTLDLELLQQQIEELNEFSPAILLSYPINPVNCITAVFNFLKYGIVDKAVLGQITMFSFNPVFFDPGNNNEAANNMIGVLMAGTLIIGQNPRKLLRVVRILNKSHKASPASSITYPFILKMFLADTAFALEDEESLLQTEADIAEIITARQAITPYLEVLVHVLKIKIAIVQQRHEAIMHEFRIIMLLANAHNLKLVKLYTTSLLLKKHLLMYQPQFIRFYREVNYEHTKIIAESQVVEFWERQLF
ncbi:hypothetical protein [Mucilaginibacter sp.]|uniref:hypothetical protein n=1 Tax=Mucilaginibacter sp. TaxID=1882438 RepID=UPI002ED0D0C8